MKDLLSNVGSGGGAPAAGGAAAPAAGGAAAAEAPKEEEKEEEKEESDDDMVRLLAVCAFCFSWLNLDLCRASGSSTSFSTFFACIPLPRNHLHWDSAFSSCAGFRLWIFESCDALRLATQDCIVARP